MKTAVASALSIFLLAGCSTNPVTGRDQIVGLPAAQVHADVSRAISSKAHRFSSPDACDHVCRAQEKHFKAQVERLGEQLQTAARNMSPELFERISAFEIGVDASSGLTTGSSVGGRISLGSGIGRLEPADDVTAFLIAREMAHVIARHDEEDSGARILFSAVTALLPVAMIARMFASAVGSNALMSTWAEQQRREADEIALALLMRTGRSAASVATSLATGIKWNLLTEDEWATRFKESAQRVAQVTRSAPEYADFDNWLLHQSVLSIERVQICMNAKGGPRTAAEMHLRRQECMGRAS